MRDRHAVLLGDRLEALALLRVIGLPRDERLLVELLQVLVEDVHLVGGEHDARRHRSADQRAAEAGVQRDELIDRHVGELRRELHVDVAQLRVGREVRLVRDRVEHDAERLGVADDVLQRLELRQVVSRLERHAEMRIVSGLGCAAVLRDRARHRVLAPVVRGEGELPVAVHLIEVLEVVERGVGRIDDVAPAVVPPVLLQLPALAGAGEA